jgi:hypothetical protein
MICRVEFFGMKMPIGIAEPLIDNLVQRYLESLTPELEPQILHHKSIFDIGIVSPTERLELYSFGIDQRRAKKYHEGQVHKMCNQSNFSSLSLKPNNFGEIKQIKIYQKIIHVVLLVIARNYLDDIQVTMFTIHTRAQQLRALLQRLERMQNMARDEEIRGTRLEITVQHVDIVHVARRMCSELDILRVQGVENILEGSFNRVFIMIPDLIQAFKDSFEKLEVAMRGLANVVVSPIRVRAALTLARHTIGWSGNNIERQLREAKAWEDREIRIRIRRQDADHVYNGCELNDVEMRVKVVEFFDHAMWCHHPRLRDQSGEALLLKRADGRGFWPKQNNLR